MSKIKSRVISAQNREKIATAIAVTAVQDQLDSLGKLLREASDLALVYYEEKIADVVVADCKQWIDVGSVDLPENDQRYTRNWLIEHLRLINTYSMDEVSSMVLDNHTPDGWVKDFEYPMFNMTFGEETCPHWWVGDAGLYNGNFSLHRLQMKSPHKFVDKAFRGWDSGVGLLPKQDADEIRAACEKFFEANAYSRQVVETFEKIRRDVLEQIGIARTTKRLAEAWTEVVPMLEQLYPDMAKEASVETPLGNVLLRHLTALPSPDKAVA